MSLWIEQCANPSCGRAYLVEKVSQLRMDELTAPGTVACPHCMSSRPANPAQLYKTCGRLPQYEFRSGAA
jgi:hypothetical protein